LNLQTYATELSAGYAELRSTLATLAEELEAAKAAEAKARHDRSVSQANKMLAKEKLEAAIKAYNEGVDAALAKNRGNIRSLRERLEAENAAYLAAKPADVDGNALALLNAGVLNASDLRSMAQTYKDNPTMLRLIGKAATDVEGGQDLAAKISTYCDPKTRLEAFNVSAYFPEKQTEPALVNAVGNWWDATGAAEAEQRMTALESFSE
jgi:hypothetical protein